jgi:hypothetical protein
MQPAWLKRFSPPRIHVPRANLAGVWEFSYAGYLGLKWGPVFTLSIDQAGGRLTGRSTGIGGNWVETNHNWQGIVEGAGFTLDGVVDPSSGLNRDRIDQAALRGALVDGQIEVNLKVHTQIYNNPPSGFAMIGKRRSS